MNDAPSRGTGASGSGGEDLIGLVAQLQDIISRQQRAIENLRSKNDRLRGRDQQKLEPDRDKQPVSVPGSPSPTPVESRDFTPGVSGPQARSIPGADFTIVFDGGSQGNPGRGYGSFQIVGPHGIVAHRTLEYGNRVTNNQAEYRTLLHALEDLRDRMGTDAASTKVAIRGDSKLVIEQVAGRWKVKHPDLQPLHERVRTLLNGFARIDLAWQPRRASVRVLGH